MSIDESLFVKMMEDTRELSQELQAQIEKLSNIIQMQNKLFDMLIDIDAKLEKEDESDPSSQQLLIRKNKAKRRYHMNTNCLHGCPVSLPKSSTGRSLFHAEIQKKSKLYISRGKSLNKRIRRRLQKRV